MKLCGLRRCRPAAADRVRTSTLFLPRQKLPQLRSTVMLEGSLVSADVVIELFAGPSGSVCYSSAALVGSNSLTLRGPGCRARGFQCGVQPGSVVPGTHAKGEYPAQTTPDFFPEEFALLEVLYDLFEGLKRRFKTFRLLIVFLHQFPRNISFFCLRAPRAYLCEALRLTSRTLRSCFRFLPQRTQRTRKETQRQVLNFELKLNPRRLRLWRQEFLSLTLP